VFVATIGKGLVDQKLQICSQLWANNIKAEVSYKENAKTSNQLEYALENYIPFIIWIGESEINEGVVKLKVINKKISNFIFCLIYAKKIVNLID
jgi:histidyl-tRNA synthetase